MEWAGRGRAAGWWALTGTPGVGKSTVARRLAPETLAVEVGALALGFGGRPSSSGSVMVDVERLSVYLRTRRPPEPVLLVGHLAHRLPVEGVIVLRCHPRILRTRLGRRRDRPPYVEENVGAEALDVVAGAARRSGAPVQEIDTSDRSPDEVAALVRRILEGGAIPPFAADWLQDPRVPDMLLEGAS